MGKWGNGEGPNVPNEDDATSSTVTNNEPSDSVISVCSLAEIDHSPTTRFGQGQTLRAPPYTLDFVGQNRQSNAIFTVMIPKVRVCLVHIAL